MTTDTTPSQAASIDTPEFRQLLKDYVFYGIERGIPPIIAHIDAKLAQARQEGFLAGGQHQHEVEKERAEKAEQYAQVALGIKDSLESRLAEIQRGVDGLTRYMPGLRWGVTGFEGGLSLVSRNEVLALLQPQGQADTSKGPVQNIEVTPELLRHLQLNTELGAHACADLAGGYSLITEIIEAAFKFKQPDGQTADSDETTVTVTLRADGSIRLVKTDAALKPDMSPLLQKLLEVLREQPTNSDTSGLPG